ncbi:dTDP-4-dehydrorhamnose 3,5-epimerase [Roseomonas sp. GC11]|uniref:dTDP-4-dehydrorhamnose 3,5-epimerase n=1 Tax=Roseomonas sp. GC11 TaxID=2950546 RepID=UPI00210DC951|nr:dTDP-4-dehydrorhamnose 3,5-epimerase [Roseomonas sp. GC11]MCQ4161235.1 dTDP-4-dehydrorhamnose 3,5-epimerase [Roseomonas sp. GC11]
MEGPVLVSTRRFGDARGYFSETWSARDLAACGLAAEFVQDNFSTSAPVGTLRGLHFQIQPDPQDKLVRCLRGRILDVAVDLRRASPTYGQHVAVELSAENGLQLFVPVGFAHGFCTLEPDCEVAYKVTGYYSPACDKGVAWDDPDLAIDWPLPPGGPVLSDKDSRQPKLAELPAYF